MRKILSSVLFTAFILYCGNIFSQGLDFTVNPNGGCPGNTFTFTNTSSNPNAYRFVWHFADGSPDLIDTLPVSVNHTYTNPGNYYVWVDVLLTETGSVSIRSG